jgi:hypothetical protein
VNEKSSNGGNVVALARPEPQGAALGLSGSVQINGLGEVFRLAERLAEAHGFVPSHLLGKPNAIAACILTGIELSMGPMEAMRSLDIIEGKPTMKPEVMLARAIRAGIRHTWERTDEQAAVLLLDRGGSKHRQSFTMEDAKRADLASKKNWQRYPAAMLRARCISAAMRAFCPDVLGAGVYLAEELESIDATAAVLEERPALVAEVQTERAPAPRVQVEIEDGVIADVPEKLADCETADELRGWISRRKRGLSGLANGARAKMQASIREHAERLGCEPEVMLVRAGLLEQPEQAP